MQYCGNEMSDKKFNKYTDHQNGDGGKNELENYETNEESSTPSPSTKIDLRNPHSIRRELASVYRDMRSGKIVSQDGTRLAYVLDIIRKSYETAVLQERLELIEHVVSNRMKLE